jgi:hypothetical protein
LNFFSPSPPTFTPLNVIRWRCERAVSASGQISPPRRT